MFWAELHCKSAFSFLRAASLPEDLALNAARLGLDALALTDFGGVYGAVRFYKACRELGIRPILGAEVELVAEGWGGGRLVLLVQDSAGWKNLCRLLTLGRMRCGKDGCTVSMDELVAHHEGLFCLAGEVLESWPRPDELLRKLRTVFGKERLLVELCRHLLPAEEIRLEARQQLAREAGLEVVATGDVLYADMAGREVLDALTCIRERLPLRCAGRLLQPNAERRLKSPSERRELFARLPRAVEVAARLAESCRFDLEDLGYRFPTFEVPEGLRQEDYLERLVWQQAPGRFRPYGEKEQRQLAHELSVIRRLDLSGYFLLVWDICRFCREQGIMVQGRGSAANSAVCYALGITAVNPVRLELLFERFLSEEREGWPDIDLDLPSGELRERVIRYLYQRYGNERAALTSTVITFQCRSALRELGLVLELESEKIERAADALACGMEIIPALEVAGFAPEQRELVFRLFQRLHGLPRHLGQHPGGMVLCGGRLDEVVPLEPARMPGRTVVQWDKDDCADAGLIKVDLLGLGMMRALQESLPLVREHYRRELDLAHLPPDDPAVYDMLCRADTVGVFQVESRAQMNTLPRLKPRCFYDLVIEVAIIRPGPIVGRKVHPYLERRAGRQPVTYPHPSLKPILERTLGIPLFQEQAMRIALEAAGYSLRQAEDLRRAMGHKRSAEYQARHRELLLRGLAERGIRGRAAEEIVESFGSFFGLYGFPESHAASFALLVYASAYLKVHFPRAFYCALLNAWPMGFYHPRTLVEDAHRHGVEVRSVDVSHSDWACRIEPDGALRLGLRYVRGLRREAGLTLERERKRAPWRGLGDLRRRCRLQDNELEALAALGALASLGYRRREALWQVLALDDCRRPLLEPIEPAEEQCPLPPFSPMEETLADLEICGMSPTVHPMSHLRPELERQGVLTAAQLAAQADGRWVRTAGLVIVRQRPPTAKGMTFFTLEDETGLVNLLIEPRVWEREKLRLVRSQVLLAAGRLENRRGVVQLRAEVFTPLDDRLSLDAAARNFS